MQNQNVNANRNGFGQTLNQPFGVQGLQNQRGIQAQGAQGAQNLTQGAQDNNNQLVGTVSQAQNQSLEAQQQLIALNATFQTKTEVLRTVSTALQTVLRSVEQERQNIRSARA